MLMPMPFSPTGMGIANAGVISGAGDASQTDSGKYSVKSTNDRAASFLDNFVVNFMLTGSKISHIFENALINSNRESGFLLFPTLVAYLSAKKNMKGVGAGNDYIGSSPSSDFIERVDRLDIPSKPKSNGRNDITGIYSVEGGDRQVPRTYIDRSQIQTPAVPSIAGNMSISTMPEAQPLSESIGLAGMTAIAGMINSSPDPENQGGNNKIRRERKSPKLTTSGTADIVTLILAVKDSLHSLFGNKNTGDCQPCCPSPPSCNDTALSANGDEFCSSTGKGHLNTTIEDIRIDVNRLANRFSNNDSQHPDDGQGQYKCLEQSSFSSMLGEILGNVQCLTNYFVKSTSEQPASNKQSNIESALTTANTTLNKIDNNVNRLAERFTPEAPDKTGNNKTQQPDWSLMLLGNIAIDVKRMADQYVGSNLNHSSNGPVFQNIRDTVWLNNTLNGIQDNTTRVVSLLPVQPNNYFNQTNNFTISGVQEPRTVVDAVRDSVPMMSDFSQANQILQAKAI